MRNTYNLLATETYRACYYVNYSDKFYPFNALRTAIPVTNL